MIKTGLYVLCLLFPCLSFAQMEHVARFEIEHDWDNVDYVVISNQEDGVLLIQPQYGGSSSNYPIVFNHLDNDLNYQWADTLTVNRRMQLRGFHHIKDKTILLFQNIQQNRLIKIVSVNLKKKELLEFDPMNIVDLQIQEFEAIQDHVIIGGYIEERPAVFAYDLTNNKVRTLSNVFQNNSELIEVKVNSDSLTFNVLSSVETAQKDRTIAVKTYDYAGNPIRSYQIETEDDHQLLNGVSSSIYDKEQTVVGLYCVKAGTFPSGLYVNHIDRTGVQTTKYIGFGEFDSFLDHNGERRAEKLKEKAMEAKLSSKVWRYKIDAVLPEMIEQDGKLYITGEFYKPTQMSTQNYMRVRQGIGDFGRQPDIYRDRNDAWMTSGPINQFQRYEINYTHAFAMELDLKGELLWDSSMDIDENQTRPANSFGAFLKSGEHMLYAFYFEKELVSRLLGAKPSERFVDEIKLKSESDKLRFENEDFQGILAWYGNKFLVYGVQNIKGEDRAETRKVFFINAVALSEDTSEND